jgi:hypothetical protein
LEDLLESCVVKDVVKEAMISVRWHCAIEGPNLHVAKAHMGRIPTTLQVAIKKINHLIK